VEQPLLQILKDTTGTVEDRLYDELSLDSISSCVHVSKFHLLRIWKGATGTGLMEYVRRRRLAASLADLLKPRLSLDFIANKHAFGSERAYNRAFKDEFNLTPARWRRKPSALNILDRFNADFMQRAGDGLVFMKAVRVLPAFSLAGIPYKLNLEQDRMKKTTNSLYVEFFYQQRPRVLNPVAKDVYYGLTESLTAGDLHAFYQPSIQVDSASIVPPDMTIRRIQAHKYGVFTYMGLHKPEDISAENLQKVLDFVRESWAPTLTQRLQKSFRFELINYARCSKQYSECDLYFPMERL
jgi:AraC family transcriptional regulator